MSIVGEIGTSKFIAIAFHHDPSTQQNHVGILHRKKLNNESTMLHLAWHQKLNNEPVTSHTDYISVCPGINPRKLTQLKVNCNHIWKKNEKSNIPYAFSGPADCFHPKTHKYQPGPNQLGLTCASFVLAVFNSAGLNLIDESTWPKERPGDKEWRESILLKLEEKGASKEHIDAVKSSPPWVRIRPEEVTGASQESKRPVKFQTAVARASDIMDFYTSINTP